MAPPSQLAPSALQRGQLHDNPTDGHGLHLLKKQKKNQNETRPRIEACGSDAELERRRTGRQLSSGLRWPLATLNSSTARVHRARVRRRRAFNRAKFEDLKEHHANATENRHYSTMHRAALHLVCAQPIGMRPNELIQTNLASLHTPPPAHSKEKQNFDQNILINTVDNASLRVVPRASRVAFASHTGAVSSFRANSAM